MSKSKYFVQFTYRKERPGSQMLGDKLFTFDIIELQSPTGEGEWGIPSLSKDGVLLALFKKGYQKEVNVLMLSPL